MKNKKFITYLSPLLIALFSFLFYIIFYKPGVQTEDFTTALLVFFGVMGSVAIVLFHTKETRVIFHFYVTASIVFPVLLLFFVKLTKVHDVLHPITLGVTTAGFIFGRFFIVSHYKRQKKE
ncbi:hypothetical protein ACFLRB_04825 [Acidobacteriota bacterium]